MSMFEALINDFGLLLPTDLLPLYSCERFFDTGLGKTKSKSEKYQTGMTLGKR